MKTGKIPNQSSISELAAILGRRGGKARMTKMTPKARSEVARKAAEARWSYQELRSRNANEKIGPTEPAPRPIKRRS